MTPFSKGLLLGVAIAAPVGPIAVLCIKRTLSKSRFSGFFTGLGAAIADCFYAAVAAFGLTFISDPIHHAEFWIRLIGGFFLTYIGIRTFLTVPISTTTTAKEDGLLSDFSSAFFLTLTNPMTLFTFGALFAGTGVIQADLHYVDASLLVLGVLLGSAAWWLILSEGLTFFRKSITLKFLRKINQVAGIILCFFALVIFGSLFFS